MPADTLSREEIERWLADLDSHGADLFSPMPLEDLAAARADMTERLWKIAPAALRATLSEPDRLASARAEGVREGWNALLREVYALHEDTVERYHDIGQRDLEGKEGAFARGRCVEAKSIARALDAISPPSEPTGGTAEPVQTDDGWVEWKGGECPVEPDAVVEVRMRDGRTATFDDGAVDEFWWGNDGCSVDIVAYRIVKPAEPSAPVAPEGDWPIITQREVDGVEYALTRDGDDYSNVKAVLAKLVREKSAALEAENAALKAESAKLRGIAARLDGEAVLVSSADEIVTRRTMDEMRTLLQGGPDAG